MNETQRKYYNQAEESFKKRDFKTSTQLLLDLYDESDDAEILKLLGESLFQEEKYVESFRLIEENFNYFVENNLKFVIQVYLKNHQFIPLRIIIQTIPLPNQEKVLKEIGKMEAENNTKQGQTNQENLRQFMHMGGLSGIKQKEILEKADELPLDEYVKGAQFNLVDPDVNPIWRVEILNNLSQLNFDKPVKFIWLDGKTYQGNPSEMVSEDDTEAFRKMQQLVAERYGQSDPIKANQMEEAVVYDLRLLYPFIDETVSNPEVWLDEIYHHVINPNSVVECETAQAADKYLTQIDQIMKTLLK